MYDNEILPHYMHKPESFLQNETYNSLGLWESPNLAQKTKPNSN